VTTPPSGAEPIPEVPGFYDYYHAVVSAYRVGRYKGNADVFMCDGSTNEMPIWNDLVCGRLAFHRIPGGHMQILSPDYVPELAKSLEAALNRAQQNASTS
jgi:thioesterase domain-containing protein